MNPSGAKSSWRAAGASVQGQSHRRLGRPCQDAHRWHVGGDLLIAAVADGAGSAACAEIGSAMAAQAAVSKAVDLLRNHQPQTETGWLAVLERVFDEARRAVLRNAVMMELEAPEFATTLLVAVAAPEVLVAGQVGDGAVVARQLDGSFAPLTRPSPQEYINETTFLTSPEYRDRAQWVVRPEPATGLVLLSDGLQMLALKMPSGEPHAAFFAPLLQALETVEPPGRAQQQLQQFLLSPTVAQRAEDDLTLVLAVRRSSEQ